MWYVASWIAERKFNTFDMVIFALAVRLWTQQYYLNAAFVWVVGAVASVLIEIAVEARRKQRIFQ